MKKGIMLLWIVLLVAKALYSQSMNACFALAEDIAWQNGDKIIATADGNYFIGGRYEGNMGWGLWLVKVNADGEILRNNIYLDLDGLNDWIVENDRIIMLSSPVLLAVDTAGNILWSKKISNSWPGEIKRLVRTSDNNFICILTDSYNNVENTVILKFDRDGNILWKKQSGNAGDFGLYDAVATGNGFTAAGTAFGLANPLNLVDFKVIEFDNSGNISDQYSFGNTDLNLFDRIESMGNLYILFGREAPGGNVLDSRFVLLAYDPATHAVVWRKIFKFGNGIGELPLDLEITPSNKILAVGYYAENNKAYTFLSCFDKQGNHLWTKTYTAGPPSVNPTFELRDVDYDENRGVIAMTGTIIIGNGQHMLFALADSNGNIPSCPGHCSSTDLTPAFLNASYTASSTPWIDGPQRTTDSVIVIQSTQDGFVIDPCVTGIEDGNTPETTGVPVATITGQKLEIFNFNNLSGESAIILSDVSGRQIQRWSRYIHPGENKCRLPLSQPLTPGVYFVMIDHKGDKRIIKTICLR